MKFQEMIGAVSDAQDTLNAADRMVKQIAWLMQGRLRQVPSHVLKALKRELNDFNGRTGEWKN